jgi:gluconolactonase
MNILASGLQFPEAPVAMADGSIVLVEIARQTVSRVSPKGEVSVVAQVPGGPNGLALGPDGQMLVCNNGGFEFLAHQGSLRPVLQGKHYQTGSIEVLNMATGKTERLYDSCNGHALKGPNDIVFDTDGGFWFTDLGKRREREMDRGFVYWARADGSEIREVISLMITPNGIGLSPDGKTLYVAETETARLWAWEIVGPGQLRKLPWPSPCGGRMVAGVGGYNRFDSLAVTASGNICIAALHAACVLEISPDGGKVSQHPMPDLGVTNLCFGGADMRTASITLSHEGRLAQMTWHEPGLRLNHQEA